MNNELVKQEIAKIISEEVNASWRQYPAAKHQIKTLTELGIIDLMPANFGHTDAKVVIEATEDKTFENNYDDTTIVKSHLMELINEAEFVAMTTIGQGTGMIFLAEGSTEQEARDNAHDNIITDWKQANIYDITKRKNLRIVSINKARQLGYAPQPMQDDEDTSNFGAY